MKIARRLKDGVIIILGTTAMAVGVAEVDFTRYLISAVFFLAMWVFWR